ncbi:phosphoserine aminotransferase [Thalassospira profundimaris]|uniref:phosphoserine transaminase n=1 Tax=Thalassospira profundimaris TaxID=502049 RepID=A0A367XC73_9PROT|nr:phosphoserine transaminase [Thalassospira profundimaris]RCK51275.1 phosphoserine aminotransferase [Thalassospira profundimaris]
MVDIADFPKPANRPASANFSSGPCKKRPGWSADKLETAVLGRSHRSPLGKARLAEAIDRTHDLLNLPDGYLVGVVPASDTGAVEMALWSMLGARGVDMLAWETFGSTWVTDVLKQLKLDDVRVFEADYGKLPDLSQVDCDRDVVFTWNGTTSGVRVPNGDWIADDRKGLTFCDATSAIFAMELPWHKLDVITYSWQKVLGGEGGHGVIILSPRAVERLESHVPAWPLPKIFRMTKGGKLIDGIFRGETINTPSMLVVEDAIDALKWAEEIGGLAGLLSRTRENRRLLDEWLAKSTWAADLAEKRETASNTSMCIKIVDPWALAQDEKVQVALPKRISKLLESENVAYDINGYRDAPPGLRIWGGATVESSDISALLPWLDWAYGVAKAEITEG